MAIEYTEAEHRKVGEKLEELAKLLREYPFSADVKEELTRTMMSMVTLLAFEVSE